MIFSNDKLKLTNQTPKINPNKEKDETIWSILSIEEIKQILKIDFGGLVSSEVKKKTKNTRKKQTRKTFKL